MKMTLLCEFFTETEWETNSGAGKQAMAGNKLKTLIAKFSLFVVK